MKKQLINLNINDFLNRVASPEPVPGGGSISALYGAIASSLTSMVARLTIGKPKYADHNDKMEAILTLVNQAQNDFLNLIDKDAQAYEKVFDCFKMPKRTTEEKELRNQTIQEATLHAAEVPLSIAYKALELMDHIEFVVVYGNRNAISDACIAMMSARNAVLGALLNVRINLSSLKDKEKAKNLERESLLLELQSIEREKIIRNKVTKSLQL